MKGPLVLALDGSAKAVSCALMRDGRLIAERSRDDGLTHSVTLLPIVDELLNEAEEKPELIAVCAGPGSFTGLRIAVSMAKGLALPGDIPCAGVMTMEAMACAAAFDGLRGRAICAMDARRNEVYNAIFDLEEAVEENGKMFHVKHLTEPRAISAASLWEELAAEPERACTVMGDGAEVLRVARPEGGMPPCEFLTADFCRRIAVGAAVAAERLWREGCTVSADALMPLYLRPSQAERLRREGI